MHNKLLFVLAALLISSGCFSQLKKGNKMAGATIGAVFFDNGKTTYSTATSNYTISTDRLALTFTPSLGWFISDDLVLGIAPVVGFSSLDQKGKSGTTGNTFLSEETSEYSIGLGGFARYYFPGSSSMRFFGQYNLNGGLAGSKTEGFTYEQLGVYVDRFDIKSSGDFFVNTGLVAGLSKFLNAHTAIDFYLGYNYSYTKRNATGTSDRDYANPLTPDEHREVNEDRKTTNNGVVLGVGFQIFIDRKK